MRRKRTFLLLELMISLVLMGIMVQFIFFIYQDAAKAKKDLYEARQSLLSERRLFLRLQHLFQSMESFKQLQDNSFWVKYKGGGDPADDFQGHVNGLLKIQDNQLVFYSWVHKKQIRQEVLFEGVNTLSFKFFNHQTGAFENHFPKKFPIMMKISLELVQPQDKTLHPCLTSLQNKTLELPFYL